MILPIHVVTLALDAMPFLPLQLATLNAVRTRWFWHVIEGVADNVACTRWCAKITPRLSLDGTTQFLRSLKNHPRVRVLQRQVWHGKIDMLNTALAEIREPCILLEIDADEMWQAWQIERLSECLNNSPADCARVKMRYFVGPNIVTITDPGYGNREGEWLRAWKFRPGCRFGSHEPPILRGGQTKCIIRDDTAAQGIIPEHWAYVLQSQVEFKEEFYQYKGATAQWLALQSHPGPWPVRLRDFLPWVKDETEAAPLYA